MTDTLRAAPVQLRLPSYKEFLSDASITSHVKAINRFEMSVFYQNKRLIPTRAAADAIVAQGLQAINEALTASQTFRLHDLKTHVQTFKKRDRVDSDQAIVSFDFEHDRLHCTFAVYDDRFTIRRRDSGFDNFYEWYSRLMPYAGQIESTIRRVIERQTGQALDIVQSHYDFRINFGDFETRSNVARARSGRNVDVLKALIPALPDERGEMREISEQDFYRLDLTLSRLERFSNGKTRNAWYFIEAPFNENGRYLVMRAQMRNSSTELPGPASNHSTDAIEFDGDFANDYVLALSEFLRDRALESFARKFLETWNFATPRQF